MNNEKNINSNSRSTADFTADSTISSNTKI